MWPFRRRPRVPQYAQETIGTQLRIIRTHQAAMAGEISTLIVLVQQLGAKLDHLGTELLCRRPAEPSIGDGR